MTPTFVSSYGPGAASTRTRLHSWIDRLQGEARVVPYLGTARLDPHTVIAHATQVPAAELTLRRLARRRNSHLCIHRQASPFGFGSIEQALLRSASHAVYDFDDAINLVSGSSPALRAVTSPAKKFRSAARAADVVIAGSEILATWASENASDVRVIPTCVEPDEYPVKDDYRLHDPPRISWLGSPSTEGYIRDVTDSLLEVHRRTGARLVVISSGDQHLGDLECMTDRVEWSLTGYAQTMIEADVAISPLTDSPWARGKCAYKMLQYGAMGLPTVASPVGTNATAGRRLGMTMASTTAEWTDALMSLIDVSADARREAAASARPAVEDHYSYTAWQAAWLSAQGLT